MNAIEECHLTITSHVNGVHVDERDIHDPFLYHKIYYEPNIWGRIKLLFTGQVLFEVRIRGDREALDQWFRTDELPRGGEGGPHAP